MRNFGNRKKDSMRFKDSKIQDLKIKNLGEKNRKKDSAHVLKGQPKTAKGRASLRTAPLLEKETRKS